MAVVVGYAWWLQGMWVWCIRFTKYPTSSMKKTMLKLTSSRAMTSSGTKPVQWNIRPVLKSCSNDCTWSPICSTSRTRCNLLIGLTCTRTFPPHFAKLWSNLPVPLGRGSNVKVKRYGARFRLYTMWVFFNFFLVITHRRTSNLACRNGRRGVGGVCVPEGNTETRKRMKLVVRSI